METEKENKFMTDPSKEEKKPVGKKEEKKGSLQDKVMTLDEIRTEERRLQSLRCKLEAEQLQQKREIKIIKDFDSLTPDQRKGYEAYYEIIDKRNMNDPKLRKAPYEFNGAQVSTLFGKQNSIRDAFFEGNLDSIYDFENRQITFLYFELAE